MTNKTGENMFKRNMSRRLFVVECCLCILLIIILCIIFCFQKQLRELEQLENKGEKKYAKHYALITENEYSVLWDNVYLAAQSEAEKYDAYLEYMGKNLSNTYSVEELLRIAIDCNVDGILVEGKDNVEMVRLIDEATAKDIPVVTVLRDSPQSTRQYYVGVNEEELGQIYGEQILKLASEEIQDVLVLLDANETMQENNVYISIENTLKKEQHPINLKGIPIDHNSLFGAEEAIRDIIVSSAELPDVIVCLNLIDTKCVYQAVVDHNKVGQVKVLGYYDAKEILEGIQKEIIYAKPF